MRSAIALCSILLLANVQAQQTLPYYQWFGAFTNNLNNIEGVGHVVDASGNVYITGQFINGIDLDPGTGSVVTASNGSWDVYIVKLDASGQYVWGKTFGGTAQEKVADIEIDASGNLYLIGNFGGTVDFDPAGGVANITSINAETYVLKLDGSGNYVWAKSFATNQYEYNNGKGIAVDGAGNVYVTGILYGTADFDTGSSVLSISSADPYTNDTYAVKLNASGNTVWAKTFRSNTAYYGNEGWAIEVDASGNTYIRGKYRKLTDFDPSAAVFNLPEAAGENAYVAKLDALGNLAWAQSLGTNQAGFFAKIKTNGAGNIFTTYGSAVVKLNAASGTSQSLFTVSNGTINSLAIDGSGNIFTATSSSAGNLGFMHNASGSQLWVYNAGNIQITGNDISTDVAGNVYLSGQAVQSNAPDYDPREGWAGFNPPWVNAFVVKLGYCNSISLASNLNSGSNYAYRNIYYNNCGLIATTASSAVWNGISGIVDAKVWVEISQPTQYVKRHYEIMPQNLSSSALTGDVILYFTQQEFNDFNNQTPAPAKLLPTGPTDAQGISNIIVETRSGTSSDGSGSPGSYAGAKTNYTTAGSMVSTTWNATANRWEVRVSYVTTWGGLFLKTQSDALPVTFNEVAACIKNNLLTVSFSTFKEKNNDHFDIEVSEDGLNFKKVSSLTSNNANGNASMITEYKTIIDLTTKTAHLQLTVVLLVLVSLLFYRKSTSVFKGLAFLFLISVLHVSCSKKQEALGNMSKESSLYVRIGQYDKDGTVIYSKIVKAVKED